MHYTAKYWEYDPVYGRRWNRDPKRIIGISDYTTFKDNPNIYVDANGDFNTKFGAWAYRALHGTRGSIQKDNESGQWFINRNSTENGESIVKQGIYDWNGSSQSYNGSGWGHQARSLLASIFGVDGSAGNLFDMGLNSLLQNSSVEITGSLLEKITQDPAVEGFESAIVCDLQSNSSFGKKAFSKDYTRSVQLGGPRGSLNPFDPQSMNTWKMAANPLTWAVRSVTIQAQVLVTAEGCMNITYNIVDNYDLRPEKGGKVYFGGKGNSPFSSGDGRRPWQYNAVNSTLGVGYHDLIGGNDQMKVFATWQSNR